MFFFRILYLSVPQLLFFYRIVFTLLADPWESPAATVKEVEAMLVRQTVCNF